ncbi:response regulator [Roseivirga sp.]|uniref:response regulator n=1 Tax=Roseivirga sp. TaxID=1964215 RepID=UPI003B8E1652
MTINALNKILNIHGRISAKLLLLTFATIFFLEPAIANDSNPEKSKPRVLGIEVFGHPKTNVDAIEFVITFSEAVTGVDISDFTLEASSQLKGSKINSVSGTEAKYKISVGNIPLNADGILSIDLKNGTDISNKVGFSPSGFTQGKYHYVGAAFDVSRAVYAGTSERFSVKSQSDTPHGMGFINNGSSLLIIDRDKASIFQYELSQAYDVSTAKYLGDNQTLYVGNQESRPRTFAFDDSGAKLFISGGDTTAKIQQYNLSRPFNISTAKFAGHHLSLDVWKQEVNPRAIHFNNDGTKLFLVGLVDDEVNEYLLDQPYQLSSAVYTGETEKLLVREYDESARVIEFNPDGTKLYIVGGSANIINEFKLSNPFDVSTAKFAGSNESFLFGKQELTPNGMNFNNDGTKLFVIGQDKDFVIEYILDAKPLVINDFSLWSIGDITEPDSLLHQIIGDKNKNSHHFKATDLRLEFATNSINSYDFIEFQTFLEGEDAAWSDWSTVNERAYPRLNYGSFIFKIRARNAYGQETEILEYSFEVLTPWYFTKWAYFGYLLIAVLITWSIIKINARRLEKEKKVLEQVVLERTEEILKQKDEIALQMNEVEQANVLIKEQADRLRELDKVKSRFFANISHELRTPLTLINAPLQSLIDSGEINSPKVLEVIKMTKRNGGSLLSLVEEILDLTKLEAGRLELTENPVRLSEFIDDLTSPYEAGLNEKSIKLKIDFQLENDLTIMLDGNKASKIFNNLLSNALKFTPPNGQIEFGIRFKNNATDVLEFTVADNGEGIHSNDLPYVFDRFYQSSQPNKKAAGGTGIGLALARELAQLFKGSLSVESVIGKGSKFTFVLPIQEVSSEVVLPMTKVEGQSIEKALKKTIKKYVGQFDIGKPVLLITEDHPEMRAFIAQTLSPYFEVKQAENGKVALEILKQERIDILISDVMMPEMDGFELLEAVKSDQSLDEVSLIMLTARAEQEDKLFALNLGIDDYLTKPFNAAEFLARIKNILENRIKILRELHGIDQEDAIPFTADVLALMKAHDLSERELEVIPLIVKQFTNPQIAEKLHVSRNTVKTHLKNIYSKLDISARSEITEKLRKYAQ